MAMLIGPNAPLVLDRGNSFLVQQLNNSALSINALAVYVDLCRIKSFTHG